MTLPRGLLLPALDRTLSWSLALVIQAALLTLGGLAAARIGRSSRRLWMIGAACLAGGLLSAELLGWLRGALVEWVLAPVPFHAVVSLVALIVAAPLAIPLGACLAIPLRASNGAAAATLLGAAAGFALGPVLSELILGWSVTLQACALVSAAAAVLLAQRAPLITHGDSRLAPGTGWALVVLGGTTVAAWRQLDGLVDLGSLGGPWLAGVICLGAATWITRPPPMHGPLLVVVWTLLLPLLQPTQPSVASDLSPTVGHALGTLALVGLPTGFLLATLLGRRGSGPVLAWCPLLFAAAIPITLWLALPRWDVRGTSWALALVGLVGVWATNVPRPARSRREALVALTLLAGLSLTGLGRPLPPDRLPAQRAWQTPEGPAAVVLDPTTGTPRLAVGGRAPLGVPGSKRRRWVHLPLLVHGGARNVLLCATDHGQLAQAALAHGLDSLVWLEPFPDRSAIVDTTHVETYMARKTGSERMLLAGRDDQYDVIIMAPDPRTDQRAGLIATTEFYRLARSRLTDDGLFCQWWDTWRTDVDDIKSAISGALTAFEHVYVMIDHPRSRRMTVAIVGTARPLKVKPHFVESLLIDHPSVHADMEPVGLGGPMLSGLILSDRPVLELLAPESDALSDDRPVLGVRAALRHLMGRPPPTKVFTTLLKRRADPRRWTKFTPSDKGLLSARVLDTFEGWGELLGGTRDVLAEVGYEAPAFELEGPGDGPEIESIAFLAALPALHDWPYLDGLVLGQANRFEREGHLAEAEAFLRAAVAAKEWSAVFRFDLARMVERQGDKLDALELYGTVLAFDPDHAGATRAVTRLGGG